MTWNKRRKELLAISSNTLRGRKKTVQSCPLRNAANMVRQRIANGRIKIICRFCELTQAQIQNEVLEQNGFSIRVDHRTLQAQKEEAEKKGDTFLARLFNRIPEEYIGVISCKENDDEKVERLRKFRSLRKQHFDLVMKIDAIAKETEELEIKDAVQISSTYAKELMDSKEYASQKFVSQYLVEMRNKMLTAVAQVNKWKRVIISARHYFPT